MKNAHQDGRVLDVTLTAAAKSGELVIAGKLAGIAVTDGAAGDTIAAHVEGVFHLPKLPAAVFAVGDPVTWDTAAKHALSAEAGAGQVGDIGYAVEAAEANAITVLVRLTPGTATAGAGGA